jgi:hypothetical protein
MQEIAEEPGGDAAPVAVVVPALAHKRADFVVTLAKGPQSFPLALAQAESGAVTVEGLLEGAGAVVAVGDLLRAINDVSVTSPAHALELAANAPDGPVRVALTRVFALPPPSEEQAPAAESADVACCGESAHQHHLSREDQQHEHHHHQGHNHHHHHHHHVGDPTAQDHLGDEELSPEGHGEGTTRQRQRRRTAGQLREGAMWEMHRRASDPAIRHGSGAGIDLTTPSSELHAQQFFNDGDATPTEMLTSNGAAAAAAAIPSDSALVRPQARAAEASPLSSVWSALPALRESGALRTESNESASSFLSDSDCSSSSSTEHAIDGELWAGVVVLLRAPRALTCLPPCAVPIKGVSKWQVAKRAYQRYRVFRRRGYPWVQLAGHAEGFKQDASSPDWILKVGSDHEKVRRVCISSHGFLVCTPNLTRSRTSLTSPTLSP